MAFVMGAALGAILGRERLRAITAKGAVAVRRHGPFLVSLEYPKLPPNPKYGQRVAVPSACFA